MIIVGFSIHQVTQLDEHKCKPTTMPTKILPTADASRLLVHFGLDGSCGTREVGDFLYQAFDLQMPDYYVKQLRLKLTDSTISTPKSSKKNQHQSTSASTSKKERDKRPLDSDDEDDDEDDDNDDNNSDEEEMSVVEDLDPDQSGGEESRDDDKPISKHKPFQKQKPNKNQNTSTSTTTSAAKKKKAVDKREDKDENEEDGENESDKGEEDGNNNNEESSSDDNNDDGAPDAKRAKITSVKKSPQTKATTSATPTTIKDINLAIAQKRADMDTLGVEIASMTEESSGMVREMDRLDGLLKKVSKSLEELNTKRGKAETTRKTLGEEIKDLVKKVEEEIKKEKEKEEENKKKEEESKKKQEEKKREEKRKEGRDASRVEEVIKDSEDDSDLEVVMVENKKSPAGLKGKEKKKENEKEKTKEKEKEEVEKEIIRRVDEVKTGLMNQFSEMMKVMEQRFLEREKNLQINTSSSEKRAVSVETPARAAPTTPPPQQLQQLQQQMLPPSPQLKAGQVSKTTASDGVISINFVKSVSEVINNSATTTTAMAVGVTSSSEIQNQGKMLCF